MKQSSMPKIKVCGLTRPEEAGMLARNRIEYAGMVLFYPKSKRLSPALSQFVEYVAESQTILT